MKKLNIGRISIFALFTLIISLGTSALAQTRAYQVTDRQVRTVLDSINSRTNSFRNEIDRMSDNGNINGTIREDSFGTMVANFEEATTSLRDNFSARRSTSNDVQEVLNRAYSVNTSIQNNRVTSTAQNQWNQIRNDLNTLAGYYRVSTNWNYTVSAPGGQSGYYVNDTQLRTLLNRLRQRSTSFRQSFDQWARYNQRYQTGSNSDVSQSISEFDAALQNLSGYYRDRNSSNANVEQVLRPSASINRFIVANRTNNVVSSRWNLVRNDLNTLAGYYRQSWDWNNPGFPRDQDGTFDSRLTGTYRLNTAQSDNVAEMVEQAIDHAKYDPSQHDRLHRNLERRLLAPETLTLEKRGQQITMSSANAPSVTLSADGVVRAETSANGRTVNTSVTATNRELTVKYEGDRMNDYYVSFTPTNNRQLRVTRRVYLENQDQTVSVTSVYDKTSQNTEWNTAGYPSNTDNYRNTNTDNDRNTGFLIPNNTSLTARLDSPISTRNGQDTEPFSMTVTSPSQYEGAVITGNVLGQKSGVVSGRANMSLTFDTIRLRDGRTYRFAGNVDQVREPNGNNVKVDNEGSIRDGSQTTRTVTRAGVGAAIGAIIGAIAGGGSGAAIGAGVGAGAGAGTVILQGRDNLELAEGTQFMITAGAPLRVGSQ